MLNIQGLNPGINSQSFWKISKLKEIISNIKKQGKFTPFIAISESWLKPHITDAQLHLDNYHVFRADRIGPKNGGALLYILDTIPINESESFDDGTCSCVACVSSTRKCIIVSFYRPPNSGPKSFENILNLLDKFIIKFNHDNRLNLIIFGDYNFPGVNWDTGQKFSCATAPTCFSIFKSFINKHFLTQHITQNTRKSNVLDLFLTDARHFVRLIKINQTPLSDHNIITIYTSFFNELKQTTTLDSGSLDIDTRDFTKLNLKTSNVKNIKKQLSETNWDSLINCPINDFPERFSNKIYAILQKYTKRKTKSYKSHDYKKILTTNRKIRKLNKKIHICADNQVTQKLKNRLNSLQEHKIKLLLLKQYNKENAAIRKIKSDPKYFFKYIKHFQKTPFSPNILVNKNNETITDPKSIADTLQKHFQSVFSNPDNEPVITQTRSATTPKYPLSSELNATKADFIAAIDEIKNSSACAKENIPPAVFKIYKDILAIPLLKFWTKSFNTGQIPQQYKNQTITPVHKKGPKNIAENFRPIVVPPE